jgi:clan AA aspartic protease (TIGR02281 family)
VRAETIKFENENGTYLLPVRINGQITIPFVLDTGATTVTIPADVFLTLTRTKTVRDSDFLGDGSYTTADGTEHPSQRVVLREVMVGNYVVKDVIANVVSVKGEPLLGQTFLSKLPSWTIDNERHVLVLNGKESDRQQATARIVPNTPQPKPRAALTAPVPPAEIEPSISERQQHASQALAVNNYPEALKWCRPAAQRGDPRCINTIGSAYAKGLGVVQNYAEAARWYEKAAENGDALGAYNMGVLYLHGRGVPQDYNRAIGWYQLAASKGNLAAKNNIGAMYENGWGVRQDYAEAMRWYRAAADLGYVKAENNVGALYGKGLGVTQEYSEAMRWFRMAANNGNVSALKNIGWMTARGLGVQRDCAAGRQLLERAAAAGNEESKANLRSGAGGACQW